MPAPNVPEEGTEQTPINALVDGESRGLMGVAVISDY